MYYVYALVDPRDDLPRYLGTSNVSITPHRVAERYSSLRTDGANVRALEWISELRENGLTLVLRVLEKNVADKDRRAARIKWLSEGEKRGWPLTNPPGRGLRFRVEDLL